MMETKSSITSTTNQTTWRSTSMKPNTFDFDDCFTNSESNDTDRQEMIAIVKTSSSPRRTPLSHKALERRNSLRSVTREKNESPHDELKSRDSSSIDNNDDKTPRSSVHSASSATIPQQQQQQQAQDNATTTTTTIAVSPSVSNHGGTSYFQSEAYKRRRNKRKAALENVQTTFRSFIEKKVATAGETLQQNNIAMMRDGDIPMTSGSVMTTTGGTLAPPITDTTEDADIPMNSGSVLSSMNSLENILQIPPPPPPPPPPRTRASSLCSKMSVERVVDDRLSPSIESSIRNELESANNLIRLQTQQIKDMKAELAKSANLNRFSSPHSSLNLFTMQADPRQELATVKRQLTQVQLNRAWEEWQWRNRLSILTKNYENQLCKFRNEVKAMKAQLLQNQTESSSSSNNNGNKPAVPVPVEMAEAQRDVAKLLVRHRLALQKIERLKERIAEQDELIAKKENTSETMSIVIQTESTESSCTTGVDQSIDVAKTFKTKLCERGQEKIRSKSRRRRSGTVLEMGGEKNDESSRRVPFSITQVANVSEQAQGTQPSMQRRFLWGKFLSR